MPGIEPDSKDTALEAIPDGWTLRKVGDDILLLSGHHVLAQRCNNQGRGVPYLTGPSDFPNGTISHSKFTEYPTTLCNRGDILVTVKGSGSGTMVVADEQYGISRQLMAIRISSWDHMFVYYLLGQDSSRIQSAATGLIPGLSRSDILDQAIVCPPVPEQRAIAAALADADRLIGALERLIAKKRAVKLAAMQQLLTGRTRLPGFGGAWESRPLGELGLFAKGKGIRRDEVASDGIPCIRYGEIYTRHSDYVRTFTSFIPRQVARTSQRLRKGDLLFAASGETAEEIGKCVAFLGDHEAYAGGDIVIFSPLAQDSMYLGYLMNHPSVVAQKARMGQGDAVVHIGARHLANLDLLLPKVDEQTAIAAVLSDMDAEIAALERRQEKTAAVKRGMMQVLLTGRVRLVGSS